MIISAVENDVMRITILTITFNGDFDDHDNVDYDDFDSDDIDKNNDFDNNCDNECFDLSNKTKTND